MENCTEKLFQIFNDHALDLDHLQESIQSAMSDPAKSQEWKTKAQMFIDNGECVSFIDTILTTVRDQIQLSLENLAQAEQASTQQEQIDFLVKALTHDAHNKRASQKLKEILIAKINDYPIFDGYHNYLLFLDFRELLTHVDDLNLLFDIYSSSKYKDNKWSAKGYRIDHDWVYLAIARGSYGVILHGTNGIDMMVRKWSLSGIDQAFLFETAFLDFASKRLFHDQKECPFIVDFKGYRLQPKAEIDMEYIPPLTAFRKDITSDHFIPIAFQLFAGLAFMHKYRICHSDLKLPNVLYDPQHKKLRIIDFGLAHMICDPTMSFQPSVIPSFNTSSMIGNYIQMPPEALICDSEETCGYHKSCFNSSIDIWNVGWIMVDLMRYSKMRYKMDAKTPEQAANAFYEVLDTVGGPMTLDRWNRDNFTCSQISSGSLFDRFPQGSGEMWNELETKYNNDPQILTLIQLLKQCLSPTPKYRIYARDALQHPVFDSIRHQYLSPDHFQHLVVPWTAQTFIQARMTILPPPVFPTSWISLKNISTRNKICEWLSSHVDADIACRALYYYDVHCWEQCHRSTPSRISQVPRHFVTIARIWKGETVDTKDTEIQEFISFITPERLLGLSFHDYMLLHGVEDDEQIFTIMSNPDFIFHPYEYFQKKVVF